MIDLVLIVAALACAALGTLAAEQGLYIFAAIEFTLALVNLINLARQP